MTHDAITPMQSAFIEFLRENSALMFGEFTTKSGRLSPYFINMGRFSSGSSITTLGEYYARFIVEKKLLTGVTTLFGPAYKGIPLCVTTAIALYRTHGISVGYSFDRKEEKVHGDKGMIVGHQLSSKDTVLIIEDVLTAGTTLREIVPRLRNNFGVTIGGVVLAVDRMERGSGTASAVQEAQRELDVQVFPLVTLKTIMTWLRHAPGGTSEQTLRALSEYHAQYGAHQL